MTDNPEIEAPKEIIDTNNGTNAVVKENTSEEKSAEDNNVVEKITTEFPDWVGTTFDPFATSPEGDDPRYSDSFVAIKQEIDKLADTDYQLVIDEAISILTTEAKDLRVAGYLILGLAYLDGIKGLVIGLQVYVQLLDRYFANSFPQKISAKITAVTWLNNNKLLFYLQNKESEIEPHQLTEATELVTKLNALVKTGLAEQEDITLPEFTILNSWLDKFSKLVKAKENEIKKKEEAKLKSNTTTTAAVSSSSGSASPLGGTSLGTIETDRDVSSAINTLVKHLLSGEKYIQAIGLGRATHWNMAGLPVNENGKTRLPAPRTAGINAIKQLLAKGDNKAALVQCETMMFEPGCNFLLDLQFMSYTAAKNMQREDVSKYIALQTVILLQRLSGIEGLKYNDDTPFAQADTSMWLDEINSMGGGGSSLQLELDEALDTTIEQARSVAKSKNLQEGLAVFSKYNAYTEKQRFKMKLHMAIMCMEDNRPELALPVLDDLHEKAEQYSLAMWDSTLHILLLKNMQNAIRGLIVTSSDEDKLLYEARLVTISNQICKTDIQQALSVL